MILKRYQLKIISSLSSSKKISSSLNRSLFSSSSYFLDSPFSLAYYAILALYSTASKSLASFFLF
jgi:hypothetical protein